MVDYNKFCARCRHYESNISQGILCGLTHAKPHFIGDCETFILDPIRDRKVTLKAEKEAMSEVDDSFFAPEKKGVQKGVLGGITMMVIAVVWFVGGYAAGIIFYYPPVLFLIGIYAFIKGLFTGNASGKSSSVGA